jgi:hypothetical protein
MDGSPGVFSSLTTGGILTGAAANPVSEQVDETPFGWKDSEAARPPEESASRRASCPRPIIAHRDSSAHEPSRDDCSHHLACSLSNVSLRQANPLA